MKIAVALRDGPNLTNPRSECLIGPLEAEGHEVKRIGRGEVVKGADLLIQTGFAGSRALKSMIDQRLPYIIMEAPFWRDYYDVHASSSWGYNGLAGGAWAPSPPDEERPKPELKPMKAGTGPTIIIGQKPTDHSLRGSDHVKWILDVRSEVPEADFRPHPLMWGAKHLSKAVKYAPTTDQILLTGLEKSLELDGTTVLVGDNRRMIASVGLYRTSLAGTRRHVLVPTED